MAARSIHIGARPTEYRGNAATRVFALIGHPVGHSLSPVFQNAALRALGLDATYVAVDVGRSDLRESVHRMRQAAQAGRLAGVNVTVPHKVSIASHLDRLGERARAIGAVNTICFDATASPVALVGRNTDVDGIRHALEDVGVRLRGTSVLVLGAGGAARAAVWAALDSEAAEICVASRNTAQARQLVDGVGATRAAESSRLSVCELGNVPVERLRRARLLIQATPLGMHEADPSPVDLAPASPDLFVFELVYQRETALLRHARAAGLRTANGLDMLVHQGAASLRAWTDLEPPLAVMKRSLQER